MSARVAGWLRPFIRSWREYFFELGRRDYYGQFGEDAFLQGYFERKYWLLSQRKQSVYWRRRRLPPGFYIDIGAYSPKLFSNTYWFYRHGWNGINIDATPGSMRSFRRLRSRDINLELAISEHSSKLQFYSWGGSSVLNTTDASTIEERRLIEGRGPATMLVPARSLASVLEEYMPLHKKIDFMSVDVEGHEYSVVCSNDWTHFRPELVMVEQYSDTIQQVLDSQVARHMDSVGYNIYAWVRPNVVYIDRVSAP